MLKRQFSACRPDGEIGKRCGLRSRWEMSLESSSLSPGTTCSKQVWKVSHLIWLTFFCIKHIVAYNVLKQKRNLIMKTELLAIGFLALAVACNRTGERSGTETVREPSPDTVQPAPLPSEEQYTSATDML